MIPDSIHRPRRLIICIDDYHEKSMKDRERKDKRDGKEEGKIIYVTGVEQIMPKGKLKWADFLSNGKNKNDLMQCFGTYLKTEEASRKLNGLELIFCGRKSIWSIRGDVVTEHGPCNHEEADTKIPLFASSAGCNVVCIAQDCDILILLIFAFANVRPEFRWQLRYEYAKFAEVNSIYDNLGDHVSKLLIHYHAISGCDTTSYFFRRGKILPFKKALKSGSLSLLAGLGEDVKISTRDIAACKEFIRTVMYQGEPKDSYLQTRMNLMMNRLQSPKQRSPYHLTNKLTLNTFYGAITEYIAGNAATSPSYQILICLRMGGSCRQMVWLSQCGMQDHSYHHLVRNHLVRKLRRRLMGTKLT